MAGFFEGVRTAHEALTKAWHPEQVQRTASAANPRVRPGSTRSAVR